MYLDGEKSGRRVYLIAESDLNDVRVIKPPTSGGYGLDAQWNDDFHHVLRALLTGERPGEHLTLQQLKLAAATVLLSPYLPLLFMGEEYAESAPFPYFVSHGDADHGCDTPFL